MKPSALVGRGVFTGRPIPGGSVVELSPVIVLGVRDRQAIHGTVLHDYYFQWAGEGAAIALGLGSIYNHCSTPNLEYVLDYDFAQIRFIAARDIEAAEELLIDYQAGGSAKDLWFDPEEG